MFNKNQITYGLSLGLLFPLAGLAFFFVLDLAWQQVMPEGQALPLRERTMALLCICMNIIPFQAFNKRKVLQSIRGVVSATVILAFLWILIFYKDLMV